MKRLETFASRFPVSFGFAVALVFVMLSVASLAVGAAIGGGAIQQQLGQTLGRAVLSLLLILIVWRLGWLTDAGFTSVGNGQAWLLVLPALAYAVATSLYALFGQVSVNVPNARLATAVALNMFCGGLMEETAFRGLIMFALLRAWGGSRSGLWRSLLVSALMFGLLHLLNLAAGKPIVDTAFQILSAMLAGIYYGVFVIRAQSIWPAVVFHGLVNAIVNVAVIGEPDFAETLRGLVLLVLLQVPIVIYALYLLRLSGSAWRANRH